MKEYVIKFFITNHMVTNPTKPAHTAFFSFSLFFTTPHHIFVPINKVSFLSDPILSVVSVKKDKILSAYIWPPEGLWLGAIASCKTVDLFFRAVHVPAIPYQCLPLSLAQGRPHSCHVKLGRWSLAYRTPLASDMKSDWSSLQDKYTEWKHWHRFYPPKKQFESQLHMDWWWVLTDKLGPLSVVLWTRQLGQSAVEGWPWQHSVNNTGCCYRKPPAVKIWHCGGEFYRLSLVIKQSMLLN